MLIQAVGGLQPEVDDIRNGPETHDDEVVPNAPQEIFERVWEPPCVQHPTDHGIQDEMVKLHSGDEDSDLFKSLMDVQSITIAGALMRMLAGMI